MDKEVVGYMCMIDWQHEIGEAPGGARVYRDVEDLLHEHDCADSCGIVEVKVRFSRVVQEQNLEK